MFLKPTVWLAYTLFFFFCYLFASLFSFEKTIPMFIYRIIFGHRRETKNWRSKSSADRLLIWKTMKTNKHVFAALVATSATSSCVNSIALVARKLRNANIIIRRLSIHFYLDFLFCIRVVFRNKIKYYLPFVYCIYI